MRLKYLELQGFKTFATKTEFVFPTGITAIVGPNGSGKSNVADAIRWVLGEQVFSVLRAKKTDDLIFAGGQGRPRAGMAEVYLTLDNSDGFFPIEYSEVVVGRRAYRDGENEYILNGSKVRLRDIGELLSKTGLARRTYTVIGQGLVDQALSLNSEERRALFEEAAGISLYRYKREDAVRKLDETHRNLDRVRDILAEIGPRVRQLERQAHRTRDYARLSAELNEMQRTWFGYHWGTSQNALREAKAAVEAQDNLLGTRRAELAELREKIEAVRRRQFDLRGQVGEWHRASSGLHTQAEALQRQLAVLSERLRSLQQQAEQIQGDTASLEAQAVSQAERVARSEAELAELVAKRETHTAAITAAGQTLRDRQAERAAIERLRAAAQEVSAQAQSMLADRHVRRTQLAERRVALERDATAHRGDIAQLTEQRTALEQKLATIQSDRVALDMQQAELNQQLAAIKREIDEAQRQADQHNAELDRARTDENRLRERYQVLTAIRASLSGFDAGTRALLSANLPGVRGVLATLIKVEPEWENALEAALGLDVQSVVVESWDTLQAARAQLGDGNGRVSLLPLDAVGKPSPSNNQDEPETPPFDSPGCFPLAALMRGRAPAATSIETTLPDGAHLATEYVACEPEIRPIVDALLNNVVVADSLDEARELRAKLPVGFHFATHGGELLRSNGAVTLGRAGGTNDAASTSLLAREREWRDLPDQIAAAERQTAQALAQHASALEAIEALARQHASVTTQIESSDQAINTRNQQHQDISRKANDLQREIDWKQGLIDQARIEIDVIDERDYHWQAEERHYGNAITEQLQVLAQLEARLATLPIDELAAQLASIQAEATVSEQLRHSQANVVASFKAALDQTRAQVQARGERLSQLVEEQHAIEAQLAELHTREAGLRAEIAAFAGQIDPAESMLRDLEDEQNRLEAEERSARSRLSEMESLYNQALIDLARREEELNHLRARIDEELGLVQLEMADLTGPQPLPLKPIVSELPTVERLPEGMEQELQRLKAHIRRLGPINPEAQAEYEESRERFDFLTQQSVDLEQAIQQLQQVIAELDTLMETSFRETFEAIAEEFKSSFQTLFGGGSAKLVLTDPENVGQTGIEVVARPPGKKQQGLALLSGGERSLTAAALMFAILKIKPPPFCILDETDAALDEANVGRFRDTIQSLSSNTQFVIITHNRGTIEAADTIYGISMGSDSASRTISLKLESSSASG